MSFVAHSRLGILRRTIALLVIVGFGFFSVESLIADICDGDSGQERISVVDAVGPSPESGGSSQAPGHTVHVCHCIHAHAGMVAVFDQVPSGVKMVSVTRAFAESAPPNPALEPQLRPPIA